jgi:2-polyprenyl-6-methoxyphenol hydroxylase-like FAD-dependent oxidoreductase
MPGPILIVGAGISGLTLAQACRKENIPFRIFERDESPSARGAGWGLTLAQSLPAFRSLVPQDILDRLPETYVNKKAVDANEKGNFTFFDLSTGEAKWKVPPAERIRVSRERLRNLMLAGLEVEWSKELTNIVKDDSGVHAYFHDGASASGSLLVACDGAHSVARRMLHPSNYDNYQLPVRFIGAGVTYPESKVAEIRKLDPYFLQGSDPRTDVFLWFSFLDVPGDVGTPESGNSDEALVKCQVMTSWPYRKGFFGRSNPSDVPNTDFGQLIWMKSLSAEWAEPFRSIVQDIPEDAEIKPVTLEDWVPQRSSISAFGGRVVLTGDAQHSMVMYRGEGANQAIIDVGKLFEQIRPLYSDGDAEENDESFKAAIERYEMEAIERGEYAVLASRRACLDAHDFKRLDDDSPLVNKEVPRETLKDERPEQM